MRLAQIKLKPAQSHVVHVLKAASNAAQVARIIAAHALIVQKALAPTALKVRVVHALMRVLQILVARVMMRHRVAAIHAMHRAQIQL